MTSGAAQRLFWQQRFEGYEGRAVIPSSATPVARLESRRRQHQFNFDQQLSESLGRLSSDGACSFHTIFICLWGTLLQRYNDTDDVAFVAAVPSLGPQPAPIIPVRINARGKKTFGQLLRETEIAIDEARAYAFSTLRDAVEQIAPAAERADHVLLFTPSNDKDVALSSHLPIRTQVLIVPADEDGISVQINYDGRQHEAEFIERIGSHLMTMAQQVASNPEVTPEITIDELEILSPREREQLLFEFNSVERYPRFHRPVHCLIQEQAARTPFALAVTQGNESLTYQELNEKANGVAAYLRDRGVGPETIVPIVIARSVEMVIGILGILKAGGAYLPVDVDAPAQRIKYILKDCQARIVLTDSGLPEGIEFHGEVVQLTNEALYQTQSSNPPDEVEWSNLAYVIYTSGTTGQPKGVLLEHGPLADLCRWYQAAYQISAASKVLLMIPYTFDASVKNIITPLLAGGQLILAPRGHYNALQILDLIAKEQVTLINCAPSAIYQVVQLAARGQYQKLSSLRSLALGGEATNLSNLRDWLSDESCQCVLSNLYGPTECTDLAAGCQVDKATIKCAAHAPLGQPIVTSQIYLLDRHGNLQPVGVIGELFISGDGAARGYLNDPVLTEEKFALDPYSPQHRMFKTGDRARWQTDGTLEFIGRSDNQVKVRGFRVETAEVEQVLLKYAGVTEVAVVSETDDLGGNQLCAYLVADAEVDRARLKAHLAKFLPAYMWPTRIVRLARLPLSPHGKIDRKALPGIASNLRGEENAKAQGREVVS